MAAVTGCTAALVSDLTKAGSYGSALGVLGSIRDTGHATGPILVGFLVVAWTYQWSFALVGGIMALGGLAFALLVPAAMCAGVPVATSARDATEG
jgi:MFS family permease